MSDEVLLIDCFLKSADQNKMIEYCEFVKKKKFYKNFFKNEIDNKIPLFYYQLRWFYFKLGYAEGLFKTMECFQKVAKLGVAKAFYEIGWIYLEEKGDKQIYNKAVQYHLKADEKS